jgi:predicted metal-dependent HD superfamily phosphohydrolase
MKVPNLSFDCPVSLIDRLVARYAEPHRKYHTWSHILACFDAKAQLTGVAAPEIDLALLFHDAIYDPTRHDNEERSAELLTDEGRRAWIDERILERAAPLVLATKHAGAVDSPEACLVVDADLSILGAQGATFDEYERDVREEYASVDEAAWSAGRTAVLREFVARPSIFQTPSARRLWEERARQNLARSLARLEGAPG